MPSMAGSHSHGQPAAHRSLQTILSNVRSPYSTMIVRIARHSALAPTRVLAEISDRLSIAASSYRSTGTGASRWMDRLLSSRPSSCRQIQGNKKSDVSVTASLDIVFGKDEERIIPDWFENERKSSKVNRKYKTKYRVTNWREYERGLRCRGDITVWFSEEARDAWMPPNNGRRGGQPRYSNLAIVTALTLRIVFRLALR